MLSTSHQAKKYLNSKIIIQKNQVKEKKNEVKQSRVQAVSSHLVLLTLVRHKKCDNKWEQSTFLDALTSRGYVKVTAGSGNSSSLSFL